MADRNCCQFFVKIFLFLQVDPAYGNVGFGSGLHGWAFTLKQFAEIYADKFGVQIDKLMKNLWGDRYFNPKTKKWTNNSVCWKYLCLFSTF